MILKVTALSLCSGLEILRIFRISPIIPLDRRTHKIDFKARLQLRTCLCSSPRGKQNLEAHRPHVRIALRSSLPSRYLQRFRVSLIHESAIEMFDHTSELCIDRIVASLSSLSPCESRRIGLQCVLHRLQKLSVSSLQLQSELSPSIQQSTTESSLGASGFTSGLLIRTLSASLLHALESVSLQRFLARLQETEREIHVLMILDR